MSIICFGELIIDFTPLESGKSLWEVTRFRKNVGGAPANVAVGLHRHGVPVRLWSKVGNDSFGKFLREQLRHRGLEVSGIAVDETHPTKLAFVGLSESGERTFEFHNRDSAELYIRPEDLELAHFEQVRIFHFGGVALLGEVTVNTLFSLLEQKQPGRQLFSFDPNIRLDLCGDPQRLLQLIRDLVPYLDVLKLSREEFRMMFPNDPPESLLEKGPSLLIITEGAEGARLYTPEIRITVPPPRVRAVDTTGAGDAFTAGILAQLYRFKGTDLTALPEEALRQAGEFASYWAGRIIAHPGAISGYFTPEKG